MSEREREREREKEREREREERRGEIWSFVKCLAIKGLSLSPCSVFLVY